MGCIIQRHPWHGSHHGTLYTTSPEKETYAPTAVEGAEGNRTTRGFIIWSFRHSFWWRQPFNSIELSNRTKVSKAVSRAEQVKFLQETKGPETTWEIFQPGERK